MFILVELMHQGARRRHNCSETQGNECVLQSSDSGHAGAVDWNGQSEEFARQIAFLHQTLGLGY